MDGESSSRKSSDKQLSILNVVNPSTIVARVLPREDIHADLHECGGVFLRFIATVVHLVVDRDHTITRPVQPTKSSVQRRYEDERFFRFQLSNKFEFQTLALKCID